MHLYPFECTRILIVSIILISIICQDITRLARFCTLGNIFVITEGFIFFVKKLLEKQG